MGSDASGWLRGGCVTCGAGSEPVCAACLRATTPPPTTRVRGVGPVPALFAYEGKGADIVRALKFREGRRGIVTLADAIADLAPDAAAVTWVPTTAARRRDRGFDQAELLGRAVARRLSVPATATLRRARGPAQTGRSRHERAGVTFRLRRGARLPAGTLLVVDDVCTTGATLHAALDALRGADARGLARPHPVVVARTP